MKIANDFDFTRRETEQNEELDVVSWAENNGWVVRKMQYVGRNGCADRHFYGYDPIAATRRTAACRLGRFWSASAWQTSALRSTFATRRSRRSPF
jgi:hypothetical protein